MVTYGSESESFKKISALMKYGNRMKELYDEKMQEGNTDAANVYLEGFWRCVQCIRMLMSNAQMSTMYQEFIDKVEKMNGEY